MSLWIVGRVRVLRRTNANSHDPVLPLTTTMNGTVTDVVLSTSTPSPFNGVGLNGNGPVPAIDSVSAGTLKFTTGLILPPPDVKCMSLGSSLTHKSISCTHLRFSHRRPHDCAHEPLVGSAPVRGKTAREPAYGPRVLVPQPGRPLSCLLQKPYGCGDEGGNLRRGSDGCRR